MKLMAIVLGAAIVLTGRAARAQETDDAAAIRERAEAYVAAYNQHDAAALANLWAEDAVYLNRDTGEPIEGRAAIGEMFASMFDAGEASQLSVTIQSIRLITPDVAIEDGTADIVSADGEAASSTYTAIHVKKDGQWYLSSVRETDMPAPPPREPSELDQLEWLVGEWVDEAEDATVRTHCQWAKNGHFLTSNFSVSVDGQVDMEGTQVIGWDAAAGQIRSWMFDSEGGFGEGVWRRVGNDWLVESTTTLSDGSHASATNIYTPVDENTYAWRSVDRVIDGEPQDDVEAISVHRHMAEPASEVMQAQLPNGGN